MLADLIANDAADYRSVDGSKGAATRQDRAAYCTDTGADRRVLASRRHSSAARHQVAEYLSVPKPMSRIVT